MQAIAHRGCTDNVRESELESDPGSKIPCHTGDSNCVSIKPGFFSQMRYKLSYPGPSSCLHQHLSGLNSACLAFVCTARTKIVVHVVKDYTFWCEKARS